MKKNETARGDLTEGSDICNPALAKGQIWKAGESYFQIADTGKKFVHYTMGKAQQQRGLRRHMASRESVRAFLIANRAELLPNP